jgi:hypothetical protein
VKYATVVLICHSIGLMDVPVCHEEVMSRGEAPMCMVLPQDVEGWKEKSIYRGDQWTVGGYRCDKWDYQPRDAI